MPIGHDKVELARSSCAHVLQQAKPTLFALLCAGSHGHYLFVALQIHCQGRQNDGGIGLLPMTNREMYAVQVQVTPVLLERALSSDFKLLSESLVEATDRAGDFPRLP